MTDHHRSAPMQMATDYEADMDERLYPASGLFTWNHSNWGECKLSHVRRTMPLSPTAKLQTYFCENLQNFINNSQ